MALPVLVPIFRRSSDDMVVDMVTSRSIIQWAPTASQSQRRYFELYQGVRFEMQPRDLAPWLGQLYGRLVDGPSSMGFAWRSPQ